MYDTNDFFPAKLWDGTSRTRVSGPDGPVAMIHRKPDAEDWSQIAQEVQAVEAQLSPMLQIIAHASTISIDPTKGLLVKISPVGDETINATSGGLVNQRLTFILINDASIRTITFGTKFKPTGTLAGTASKTATVTFISDGANWYETGRSVAIT